MSDIEKTCGGCIYYHPVTNRTGVCREDKSSPVYPKIDEHCACFKPTKEQRLRYLDELTKQAQDEGFYDLEKDSQNER